ncbi:MAG: hypothetical protein ACRC6X_01060 [Culicoidibacterales bacterium]
MGKIIFENEEMEKLRSAIDDHTIEQKEKRSRENSYEEVFSGKTNSGEEREYYLGKDSLAMLAMMTNYFNETEKNCSIIILDGDYGTGKTNLLDIYESISISKENRQNILIEKLEIFQSGYEENLLHYITTSFEDIRKNSRSEKKVYKRSAILKRGMKWIIIIAAIPIIWDVFKFIFSGMYLDVQNQDAINFFNIGNMHHYVRNSLWIFFFGFISFLIVFLILKKVKKYKSDMMIYKKDYQEYFFDEAIEHVIKEIDEIPETKEIIIGFEDIDRIYKEENIIEILRIIFNLKQKINQENDLKKKLVFILTLSMENLRERFKEKKLIEASIMKLNPLKILQLKPQAMSYGMMVKKQYHDDLMLPEDESYLDDFLSSYSHLINWRMLWSIPKGVNFYYACLKLILSAEYVQFKDEGEYIEISDQNISKEIRKLFEETKRFGGIENGLFLWGTLKITWWPKIGVTQNNAPLSDKSEGEFKVEIENATIDQLSLDIRLSDSKTGKVKKLSHILKLYLIQKNNSGNYDEFLTRIMETPEIKNFLNSIKEEQDEKFDVDSEAEIDISSEMVTYLNEVVKVENFESDEVIDDFFTPVETEELRKIVEQYIVINDKEEHSLPLPEGQILTTSMPTNIPTRTKKIGDNYGADEGIDFGAVIVPKPISSTLGQVRNKTAEEQKDELLTFYHGGGKVDEQ